MPEVPLVPDEPLVPDVPDVPEEPEEPTINQSDPLLSTVNALYCNKFMDSKLSIV